MRLPVSGTKARYSLDLGLLGSLNRMLSSGIFRPPLDSRTLRSIRATKSDYGLVLNTARRKVILQPQKALEGPASSRLDNKENDKGVVPKAKRSTAARAFMNGKKVKVEVQKDVIPVTLGKAFEKVPTFDLQANVNTLMFINGVVLLEKGLWELWVSRLRLFLPAVFLILLAEA